MHRRYGILHKFNSMVIFFILIFVFINIFPDLYSCRADSGNAFYVGGTGIGNYTTVQDAINNSSNYDSIYVYNGIYYENLLINKSINLVGFDKNSTFINSNNSLYTILIRSSMVNITGFTIKNGKVGIYISGFNYSFNNIIDNTITDNWEGIRLYNSSNNKIYSNIIRNNSNYGILLFEAKNNHIFDNIVKDEAHGIYLGRWSDKNVINKNNFTENGIGISLDYSYSNLLYDNSIMNNTVGISFSYSNNNNATNNIIEYNDQCGIYISYSDNNVIFPNSFSNNYENVKEESKPPTIKAPSFEIFSVICAMLLVLFFRLKVLKF